jgi:hypothetical protein
MSFYQTSNSSIVRFNVHDPSKKVIAPFANLTRVVQIANIGAGTGYGGAAGTYSTGIAYNNQFYLSPEMLQNGSLIISPTGVTGAGGAYILPSAYDLQEYLGGRGAFNMLANLTTASNTGSNDYMILNVYNLTQATGWFVAGPNASGQKPIVAATTTNDAVLTPVLLQFSNVNSPYATIPGTASVNGVTYTVL